MPDAGVRDVVVDATPIARGHAQRGIGAAVRGLLDGLREVLAPDERPRMLVTDRQTPPPGFPHASVTWPAWQIERLPDLWPRLTVERQAARLSPPLFHATQHELVPLPQRVPLVATCYDLIPWDLEGAARRRAWLVLRNLRRMRGARAVCCFTHATATQIVDVLGVPAERVHVIPLAPAPSVAPAGGARDRPFVLYANSLEPHKNPHLAVDALAAGRHDLDLVVAGVASPPMIEGLLEYARRRGVADRVIPVGYVPADVLAGLRRHAVAMLVPSRIEGFGLPALEAMMAGTPVLVSDIPVLRETAGGGAQVCPLEDPAAWGRALDALVEDDTLRRAQIDRGRQHAETFTWRRTAAATVDVWREMM